MPVTCHQNSIFGSVSYRIGNFLLDPGDIWDGFYGVESVLLTHAHFDHIYGINQVLKLNPDANVYTNNAGREMLLDAKKNFSLYHENPIVCNYPERITIVSDRQIIRTTEEHALTAIFTSGHNPSCITWLHRDYIFTGDSYIPGIKVVTNLPGGNKANAEYSLKKILDLSINRKIYPGHKIELISY